MEAIRLIGSDVTLWSHIMVLEMPVNYLGETSWADNNSVVSQFVLTNGMLWFVAKFCLIIGFLILIRGGTPRYRYDFLTKLGWLKFLSLTLSMALGVLLLILLN